MRAYFVAAVCAFTLLLGCFLAPERADSLSGTWVIYAGGSAAPDILHFEANGTGEGYELPEEYEEVWLQGKPVPEELLADPKPFRWLTTGDELDQLALTFEDGNAQTYELAFEEDLDGTGLPGINLAYGMDGGGYVQVSTSQ